MLAIEKRFWARVNKTDKCWNWIGDNSGGYYGRFQYHGKRMFAHRISYMLNVGSIMDGEVINHICMNKRCVKPSHLETVSSQANAIHYQDNRSFV